jgi:hypothetical protein
MGDDRSPTNLHCEVSPTSSTPVDILSGEAIFDSFKLLLTNPSLNDFSSSVRRPTEAHRERIPCSILRCPEDSLQRRGTALNLPESHRAGGKIVHWF